MDLFRTPDNSPYKLLQLTPELTALLRAGQKVLVKSGADKSDLVLVSDAQTWKLRQMDQTNEVILHEDLGDRMVGVCSFGYEYELSRLQPQLRFEYLPFYGEAGKQEKQYALRELIDDTAVLEAEFMAQWYENACVETDGACWRLPPALIKKFLDTAISTMILQKADYTAEPVPQIAYGMHETVVATLQAKFFEEGRLNNAKIAHWYGVDTLKGTGFTPESQFYLQWSENMPAFYRVPLDLNSLRGHFYRADGAVRYLDPQTLSLDFGARLKELFRVAKVWDMEDIAAFLQTDRKLESVLLKHCRVKRVGKQRVVSSR